jgi:hypothetical protein
MGLKKIFSEVLHAIGFVGPLTGNVTGNVSGSSGSCTGNAATVTTNANLTGPITSVGNATSIASQTGTGTKFVVDTSPTIATLIGQIWKPASDGANALRVAANNGTTIVMSVDTTNLRVGFATTAPQATFQVGGSDTTGKFFRIQNGGVSASSQAVFVGTDAGSVDKTWYIGVNPWATDGSFELKSNAGVGIQIDYAGQVGLGKAPAYQFELSTDSAGKPGLGGLWTVVSDERIKKDIVPADLTVCYDNIKNLPLKYFGWADGVYSEDQVQDRHGLGWIAQDVQKVFPKAVSKKSFIKFAGNKNFTTLYPPACVPPEEKIEDCLDLNSGQLIASLYGAVQQLISKVEVLEAALAKYEEIPK